MSSELRPAMAEEISVTASPDDRASALMPTTSSIITPSTTHSGLLDPEMDVAPRTRIFGAVPKVPLTFCTLTPAARPSNERLTSAIPLILALAASIFVVEPVNSRLSVTVIPVTTTSFNVWLGLMCTIMPFLAFTVWAAMPT